MTKLSRPAMGSIQGDVQLYRQAGVQIVYEIMEEGAYANLQLSKHLRVLDLSRGERKLLTEMVNGTVRMVKHLDEVLNVFLQKPVAKQNPWLRTILRVSAYQILFMDRLADYACVNEAVILGQNLCNQALSKVINGVLRNLIRQKEALQFQTDDQAEYLAVFYSHPLWMVNLLLQQLGQEITEKILFYNNQAPTVTIRSNLLLTDRNLLLELLAREGIATQAHAAHPQGLEILDLPFAIENSTTYKQGYFYVQNPASMLAATILAPRPGELVYDLCCGVGGKTAHLAEMMHNQGTVAAMDLYNNKLKLLQQNCSRLKITNVQTVRWDLRSDMNGFKDGDRVLLDAPCSGLGVLKRRADSRWRIDPESVADLIALQKQLLRQAADLVKPGGLLLYSTCTINRAENQDQVETFLNHCQNFYLEDFTDRLPPIVAESCYRQRGIISILPGQVQTDGMFYALMRRK